MAGNAALSYNNQVWSIPVNWHDKPEYRNIRLTGVKTSGAIKLNEYELEQINKTREEILSLGSQEGLIQHETKEYIDEFPCAYKQWKADTHCSLNHGYAFSMKFYFGANELFLS